MNYVNRMIMKKNKLLRYFSTESMKVFDRNLKRKQKNHLIHLSNINDYSYLRDEMANRLVDRLQDIQREFPLALDLGAGLGHIYNNLILTDNEEEIQYIPGGIKTLIEIDTAENLLLHPNFGKNDNQSIKRLKITADEEFLPTKPDHFNLVLSCGNMHWINDIPETLKRIYKSLKSDGVFLCVMLGGERTLHELRSSFLLAEKERINGHHVHLSPYVDQPDMANLLTQTNFNLTTIDTEYIQVHYPNAFILMEHLQKMGENKASYRKNNENSNDCTKDVLLSMASIYQTMYGHSDGTIPATFQLIFMIGWKPHESQQKPKRRGSAQRSLKDLSSKSF